ncbi:MAG: hypothetical protein ACLP6E_05735 [Acidimicrobiales bacterium]
MPDLAEQIRTVIDAGGPSISADEVMSRSSQPKSYVVGRRRVSMSRRAAVAWGAVVTVALAALVVGVGFATLPGGTPDGGAPLSPHDLTTRSFVVGVDRVRFTDPSIWEARQYLDDQRGFSLAVVFVASQSLHDPCTTTDTSKVCLNYAVSQLARDGVYLEWSYGYDGGAPGPGTAQGGRPSFQRSAITVDGRPATMDVQTPGACASIGGDESIAVYVGPGSSGWLMEACLRGPDLNRSYSQILSLLESTRFNPQIVSP